jgi:hypothetical protein
VATAMQVAADFRLSHDKTRIMEHTFMLFYAWNATLASYFSLTSLCESSGSLRA